MPNNLIDKKTIIYAGVIISLCLFMFSGVGVVGDFENQVPIGGVMMWTGDKKDFNSWGVMKNDTDWHLCNGKNGTTNLGGLFIAGFDNELNDYDVIGYGLNTNGTTGENKVSLTIGQLPYHEHTFTDIFHSTRSRGLINGLNINAESSTSTLSTTSGVGNNKKHENRPPYYVVAYIQKIT